MADDLSTETVELRPNVYQFKFEKPGSHVYLVKGSKKNLLVDTSTTTFYPNLKTRLRGLGLKPKDIHFVILTHEHFDHIGAAPFFFNTSVVAAHRLAANKIEMQDEFVTMMKYCNISSRPFYADIWLEDGSLIDLGSFKLQALHTPGTRLVAYVSMRAERRCFSAGIPFSQVAFFAALLLQGMSAIT